MQRARLPIAAAVGLLVAGCLTEAPSPPPSLRPAGPSASTAASHPVSPSPFTFETEPSPPTSAPILTFPPGLPTRATAEQDGVRLTIELERNPMPAGQPTWITKTITNTGRDAVVYYPCDEAASVSALTVGIPWRPGRDLPNPAKTWKEYLLGPVGLRSGERSVIFLPKGQDGSSSGCGDVGFIKSLAPGASIHERSRWDGYAFRQLAPPPTAGLDLIGRFSFDRGDPLAEHPPEDRHLLEVHLDTWIDGLPEAFLDPAEAVDVALTDPRLTALLESRVLRNGNEGVLRFEPRAGVYQIGMLESGGLPVARAHLVSVDARTGEIVGFVERDWNYQVDGYP